MHFFLSLPLKTQRVLSPSLLPFIFSGYLLSALIRILPLQFCGTDAENNEEINNNKKKHFYFFFPTQSGAE